MTIMQNKMRSLQNPLQLLASVLALTAMIGCQSGSKSCCAPAKSDASAPVVKSEPAPAPAIHSVAAKLPAPIRIKAGVTEKFTDSSGNVWLPEQGFDGGDVTDRPGLEIANTKDPALYFTEHYSMNSFSQPLPNGKYVVKLHFCETYEGIEGAGQRVFSFNVQGHEFKDLDIFAKTGGPRRAYIETVNVDITDGKLLVTFTPNVENPQINAIEIIPAN